MDRINRVMSAFFLSISLTVALLLPARLMAAPMSDEELKVLQESLSIVEIDREIARIEKEQQLTEQNIQQLELQLKDKNNQIRGNQEQAGKRLAAYYMGERETLLSALLSANSLKDFFSMLDYYQLIAERDRYILNSYKTEYADLAKTKRKLDKLSSDLDQMKAGLLQQRKRVALLQQSVDGSLSASVDPEKLKEMIRELTVYWENVGLYEVRRYFRALSAAMSGFPDFLKDHEDSLSSDKEGYILTVKEEDLNNFLHGRNELLKNMSFVFEDERIVAQGRREGLELKVEGHYTVENEPQNSITFHVDRLLFNGLELPDTTRLELEKDFDLGFYPKKIVPFVEATEAEIRKGTLIIKLKIAL
ncbi:coiled-coil domain-containing protein [Fontibacillus phaseoli]|uniref:coiled-coil domain-containing protein n=1 Tax=Fontibacillus phaseoli TaxID=1416533 RepID=UPI001FE8CE37|nr:hypothetical protein [Fontibacillus phaseoli]